MEDINQVQSKRSSRQASAVTIVFRPLTLHEDMTCPVMLPSRAVSQTSKSSRVKGGIAPFSASSCSPAPNSRRFKSSATSSTAKATPYICSSAKGPGCGKRVGCKVEYKIASLAVTKPHSCVSFTHHWRSPSGSQQECYFLCLATPRSSSNPECPPHPQAQHPPQLHLPPVLRLLPTEY